MLKDNSSPILVLDPYSENRMNVEPVFKFLDINGVNESFDVCDNVIRYIAMTETPDYFTPEKRQDLVLFLYEVRDMLKGLSECQISIKK